MYAAYLARDENRLQKKYCHSRRKNQSFYAEIVVYGALGHGLSRYRKERHFFALSAVFVFAVLGRSPLFNRMFVQAKGGEDHCLSHWSTMSHCTISKHGAGRGGPVPVIFSRKKDFEH